MKSFNIDIIFPWEVGLAIVIFSLILIVMGVSQSKKNLYDDIDNIPFINPITKIFFGSIFLIFGAIQLLPLLK